MLIPPWDKQLKQLSEIILCIFCDDFKVYLSNIDSETAEYKAKNETLKFGRGRHTLLWFKI